MVSLAILVTSFIVLFVIILTSLILIVKYSKLAIRYSRLSKYLYNYLNIITSARYGNLNTKCPDGVDPLTIQISRNTNGLIESIFDRDTMIKEYIEKERQSQNLKQDFISGLTHDLKVPIIAQDNTYDMLLDGRFGEISSSQKNVIQNLKISNNDLKNLIVNLLDAQKLDRKEILIDKRQTDIIKLTKELLEQNKSILTFQNKIVNFIHPKNELNCLIDPFLIKRALNNLISNAIFYANDTQNIEITIQKTGSDIEISVKDEGKGINEKDINNIFQKYYTSQKKYSNLSHGLGLYIVNKIAIAHNGKITAKNNTDKGACFTILIPVNDNQ